MTIFSNKISSTAVSAFYDRKAVNAQTAKAVKIAKAAKAAEAKAETARKAELARYQQAVAGRKLAIGEVVKL